MRFRLFSATVLLATIGISYAADPDAAGRGGSEKIASPDMGETSGRRAKRDPVLPVNPQTGQPVHTGRILVKVRDDAGFRAPREFTTVIPAAASAEADEFSAVLAQFGGQVRQLITSRSDAELAEISANAEARSGNPQPDLTSLLVVETPSAFMMVAAEAINQLDIVEFVEIEQQIIQAQNCPARIDCGPPNANTWCNRPRSWGLNEWSTFATNPNFPDNPLLADAWTQPPLCPAACTQGNSGCNPDPGDVIDTISSYSGCEDTNCCELVSSIPGYEACSDGDAGNGWDIACAALANLLCGGLDAQPGHARGTIYSTPADPTNPLGDIDTAYDPCFSDFQINGDAANVAPNPLFATISAPETLGGSCFVARDSRGCNQPKCCFNVCNLDPLCCDLAWDAGCVSLAEETPSCIPAPVASQTPFTAPATFVHPAPGQNTAKYQYASLQQTGSPAPIEVSGWPAFQNAQGQWEPKVPLRNEGPYGSNPINNCAFTQPATFGQGPRRTVGMQAYTTFEAVIPGVSNPPPACQPDEPQYTAQPNLNYTPFDTFSQYRGGGIDLYGLQQVMYEFAQYYQGGGTNYRPYAYGGNVRVGVIDLTANLFHEDFQFQQPWAPFAPSPTVNPAVFAGTNPINPNTTPPSPLRVDSWTVSPSNPAIGYGQVKLEPGVDQVFLAGDPTWAQHGTAVLSILLAAENQFGVTGIASHAEGYFFPALLAISTQSGTQLTYRIADAMTSAVAVFDPGDVVCIPLTFASSQPLTTGPVTATLIKTMTDSGIIAVVSAGNGGVAVAESGTGADTNAILVGSTTPGRSLLGPQPNGFAPNCALASSNFTDPEEPAVGGVVQVAAWGQAVVAAGYGDLFRGQNDGTPPAIPQFPGQTMNDANDLRSYTASFGGTSAAAAMIAGIAANIQGFAKQVYADTPIGPEPMLGLLTGPQAAASLTCNNPDSLVGHFPNNLADIGYDVIHGEFFGTGAGAALGVDIINGFQIGQPPAVHQVRLQDGVFLKVGTVSGNAGQRVRGLVYPITGNTTDVVALMQSPVPPDEIDGVAERLQLELFGRTTGAFALVAAFLYNYESGRWDWHGLDFYDGQNALAVLPLNRPYPPSYNASQYLDPSNGEMMIRLYTCGFESTPSQIWHDLIQVSLGDPTKEP